MRKCLTIKIEVFMDAFTAEGGQALIATRHPLRVCRQCGVWFASPDRGRTAHYCDDACRRDASRARAKLANDVTPE